ncbi:sigma-70 family RNA polymerase sigma factor [Dyadobacter chenwenxiniae]|uniref:Sigma-70 family RNA polymerase sigma factor n=1 Tax=Dyadobacter chenwenxiniae TaxID=2906456 RepID=A0A9X1TM83_9BACT|nr:sigma-70 family RNA polymerase sigma factor [Dyadobacter chenwenxiniae]MCF0063223.1 sigma-70 family RNA polymerase sigma factor [Dyadobacter chenwenxiniae]UON85397.1 sigma-70 family RNA polymerase sigma factor [Dyadobacter chenwenxiniae]
MSAASLIPDLFRTEYRKIVAVLCYHFGFEHIEIAEDIVSDTFLAATESWGYNGLPENPNAWLYTVAKNKAKNHLKRSLLFTQKLAPEIRYQAHDTEPSDIDLSSKNIEDSQLAMIFAVCHPSISRESQVALALNLLCGFGIQEIANAFLTEREVIYKRISRAKEKLKEEKIRIGQPTRAEIHERLEPVLKTLYLVFSEGYYSSGTQTDAVHANIRKSLCAEAIRLNYFLVQNDLTNTPATNALLALMSFHASRLEARISENGEAILYEDQDETLWNRELIDQGIYFLRKAAAGTIVTRYHLEAGIAYWHTIKEDSRDKWENILDLYNQLLVLEYSPIAALNRTFALARARGKATAIVEAEKLSLTSNHLYYALLGNLYTGLNNYKAKLNYEKALELAVSAADKVTIQRNMDAL